MKEAEAELLVAEAGAVDLTVVAKGNAQLKQVIWVTKQGSRHMDWNEVPAGIGKGLGVSVWHELVEDKRVLSDTEVLPLDPKSETPSITSLWPSTGEFIEYKPEVFPAAGQSFCSGFYADLPFLEPYFWYWRLGNLFASESTP
jgi:hypothetical protein